jgi:hypothetical protein
LKWNEKISHLYEIMLDQYSFDCNLHINFLPENRYLMRGKMHNRNKCVI